MANIEILKSQRGKDVLIHDGFIYNSDGQTKENTQRWRCRSRACRGALWIEGDSIVKVKVHNHLVNEEEVGKLRILAKISDKATQTREASLDIICEEIAEIDTNLIQTMPKLKSIVDNINRKRNKILGFVPSQIYDIPDNLKYDKKGNIFLRFDSGINDDNRYIIFFAKFKELRLQESKLILIDGTFKSCPSGFYQLVTIHGYILDKTFPFVYILFKTKRQEDYTRAFAQLQTILKLNVKIIITDFELGLVNAIKAVFPYSIQKGCYFHFSQAIWRKIQIYGFVQQYKTYGDFYTTIRKILSLAFIKKEHVYKVYRRYRKVLLEIELLNIHDFVQYLDRTYFGIFEDEQEQIDPLYEIAFWNVYERVLNDLPRTTNSVEAWHRKINQKIKIKRPNIAYFVNKILDEEEVDRIKIIQLIGGKFNFAEVNYTKEYKLKILVKNIELFEVDNYLGLVSSVFEWRFEE